MKIEIDFGKIDKFLEKIKKNVSKEQFNGKEGVIDKLNKGNKKGFLDKKIEKKTGFYGKGFEKHKKESLKLSVFVSLFFLLIINLYIMNLLLSIAFAIIFFLFTFLLTLQIPILKKIKIRRKIEAEMPAFLTNLITELKTGKSVFQAIENCSSSLAGKEYHKILEQVKQGVSFQSALQEMNAEFNSLIIKRVNSNLNNIYLNGNDVYSLKKFTDELLLRQRIESKEFSGKMVVYALVFIAVSAIVPAMFTSFILIGSYFMEINFSALQVFCIIVFVFPIIDALVLFTINSKTPIFLRGN